MITTGRAPIFRLMAGHSIIHRVLVPGKRGIRGGGERGLAFAVEVSPSAFFVINLATPLIPLLTTTIPWLHII